MLIPVAIVVVVVVIRIVILWHIIVIVDGATCCRIINARIIIEIRWESGRDHVVNFTIEARKTGHADTSIGRIAATC